MNIWLWLLIGWLAFDAVVYVVMWFENAYYRKHLAAKFKQLMVALTEEE